MLSPTLDVCHFVCRLLSFKNQGRCKCCSDSDSEAQDNNNSGQISQHNRTIPSKLTINSFKAFMLKVEINAGGGLVQMFTGDNCTFLLANLLYHIKQQYKKL